MELYQFRHSAFCEKVRLVLAVKGLDYTVVEVSPGLGQLELFRLSGQRQVPVLVDGSEVIADSTAIALCKDNSIPIVVFDLFGAGNIARAVAGEAIGTRITPTA